MKEIYTLNMIDDTRLMLEYTKKMKEMKRAVKNYFDKLRAYPNYYENEDFSKISSEIKSKFVGEIVPVERQDRTTVLKKKGDRHETYHITSIQSTLPHPDTWLLSVCEVQGTAIFLWTQTEPFLESAGANI